ncbi:Crp/Fnr family transcriptional regulator [Urechidicola sp. KH5]
MIQELKQHYGGLFEPELLQEINAVGVFKEIPEGFILMDIGQYVRSMPLLIDGAIKILREDDEGDELLLYYLEKGETCAMTLACCLGQSKSEILAVAESPTKLVMVPIQKMEEWTSKYKSWRNFVFESYHTRLQELMETVDSLAFLKMDERILKYLHEKAKIAGSNEVLSTHQEIAFDLHTSRVVISRLLKALEKQGTIVLQRNKILIND